jgi:hypothetical protein
MSAQQPLLDTIEPDDDSAPETAHKPPTTAAAPVVLTPTNRAAEGSMATNANDAESGIAGIFRQSAHPVALFFLFCFRTLAIVVYIPVSWVLKNYVLSTVLVVILLAMDFWTVRNVAGRVLVGLRYWNQVDEDGESYWVFESRDPSRPPNVIDSKMFWIALYSYPALWIALLIVALLKLDIYSIPIVILALVFKFTNVIGFTYADRDAKKRWADAAAGGWGGLGGVGGQLLAGAVKSQVNRIFR